MRSHPQRFQFFRGSEQRTRQVTDFSRLRQLTCGKHSKKGINLWETSEIEGLRFARKLATLRPLARHPPPQHPPQTK